MNNEMTEKLKCNFISPFSTYLQLFLGIVQVYSTEHFQN